MPSCERSGARRTASIIVQLADSEKFRKLCVGVADDIDVVKRGIDCDGCCAPVGPATSLAHHAVSHAPRTADVTPHPHRHVERVIRDVTTKCIVRLLTIVNSSGDVTSNRLS